jgi:hypothetical protein|tara:strand:- start:1152 stop:1310 length:159 start_codon:yes stop_codon:yes gene_type:complete
MLREIQIGDLVEFAGNVWLVIQVDWSGALELLRGKTRSWAMKRQVEIISESR